ncbi:MAG: hypothetical protein ACYCPT_13225, partial [Acidimicrobiales bacterium]
NTIGLKTSTTIPTAELITYDKTTNTYYNNAIDATVPQAVINAPAHLFQRALKKTFSPSTKTSTSTVPLQESVTRCVLDPLCYGISYDGTTKKVLYANEIPTLVSTTNPHIMTIYEAANQYGIGTTTDTLDSPQYTRTCTKSPTDGTLSCTYTKT